MHQRLPVPAACRHRAGGAVVPVRARPRGGERRGVPPHAAAAVGCARGQGQEGVESGVCVVALRQRAGHKDARSRGVGDDAAIFFLQEFIALHRMQRTAEKDCQLCKEKKRFS